MIFMNVSDVMLPLERVPVLPNSASVVDAIEHMTKIKLGICLLVDENTLLTHIFTDGDLRRLLLGVQKPLPALLVDDVCDYANAHPVFVHENEKLLETCGKFARSEIQDLPVLDSGTSRLVGLLHIHPVLIAVLPEGQIDV